MLKLFKSFLKDKKGTSTVEFVLTVWGYFFVMGLIFEFGRMSLASAYLDLAISESVRIAKNQQATYDAAQGSYEVLFKETFAKQQKLQQQSPMGFLVVRENKTDIEVKYAETINDLLNGNFRQPKRDSNGNIIGMASGADAAIASYKLTYNFEFLLPMPFFSQSWGKSLTNQIFTRTIVALQEYERDKYKYE